MEIKHTNILNAVRHLESLLLQRLDIFFAKSEAGAITYPPIALCNDASFLYGLLTDEHVSAAEKAIFLIALVPHLQPNFFDTIIQQYLPHGGDFAEIGGVKTGNHRSMQPTGETAQFILAGNDLLKRIAIQQLLIAGKLVKEQIVMLEPVKEGETLMSGRLQLAQDAVDKVLFGKETGIKFGADFPAKKITTNMTWDDLVLNSYTHSQINDIMIWLQHNSTILEDDVLQRKIKPGYRVLFYGSSGTGKTLTATLLGKQFDKDVYRIDISQMVSKYIGETEKNLEKVFAKAEHKDWILFFDEADALFGKRTNIQNAHDRYANQEVSYLLQRIEDYPGLLILASNFKSNMDDAFLRRFHSIIHFPNPKPADRLKLWQKTLPAAYKPEVAVNLNELSEKYDLNGAAILNVIHYATLKAASRCDECIRHADIIEGIRKEYRKEERSIS